MRIPTGQSATFSHGLSSVTAAEGRDSEVRARVDWADEWAVAAAAAGAAAAAAAAEAVAAAAAAAAAAVATAVIRNGKGRGQRAHW